VGTRIVFRVRKEGPNHGRVFAKCTDCQRFDWLTDAPVPKTAAASAPRKSGDAERDALQATVTPCPKCGKPRRALRVSKEGPNHGRLFLACSDRECDSFEWADTLPGTGGAGQGTSTEAGLLQAIDDTPHDDAPRLIYADWLEDNGQPERAELVRVQCELARIPPGGRAAQSRRREQELLDRNAASWTAPLAALGATGTFRRGLLEQVEMTPFNFARHADELFRAAPVRALTTPSNGFVGVRALTGCQHLLRLDELVFTRAYPLRRKGAKLLVESPNVANLTHLGLAEQELTRPALADLAASPHLARLTHLDLSVNLIPRGGLAALAGSPHLANLTSLDLRGNRFSDEDGAAFASSPYLTKLAALYLDLEYFSPDALVGLLASNNLAGLTTLHLGSHPRDDLDDARARALTSSPVLGHLTALSLASMAIGDTGVTELASTAAAARLTSLGLRYCGISGTGIRALASSAHLANLTSLDLSWNDIGDEGARALAESPDLKHLAVLNLCRCGIGRKGAEALAASPNLPDHLILHVAENHFGKSGQSALARFFPAGG
jgi:uncharacterized protein (TIGR02996 family)